MPLTRRSFLGFAAASLPLTLPATTAEANIALPTDLAAHDITTVTSVATRTPRIAMSFDDGPHPRLTPHLLDLLAARGIKATFYVIGRRVAQHPRLTARIAEEGHEIGNHSWSHPFLNRYGTDRVLREVDQTTAAVFDATGRAPVTFRPPYGAFSRSQRQMLHKARGLPSVLWSVDPRDWKRPGAQVVAQRILRATRPGAIVLSHDIHPGTIQAMPSTLDGLRGKGFQFTTVSELLGWPVWSSRRFVRR